MLIGAGVTLVALGLVGMGVMTITSEKTLDALDSSDLVTKPYIKKLLDAVGMEVIDLSEEERMGVIEKLDYYVKKFAENWSEGDSNIASINLSKLGIFGDAVGLQREINALREKLVYLPTVEEIEVCEDRFNLLVTVDEDVLMACYEAKLDEWKTQGQLERYEYCRSRGVI